MNTTDYFTYVNAMFIFCIFTCGLLLAVGWRLTRKSEKLKEEQDAHLKATKINSLLAKENKEIDDKLARAEHKLRDAEKEIRELQGELSHAFSSNIALQDKLSPLITKLTAAENELEATKAKVRKRDANGKFLPSGNARPKRVKKVKSESPKLVHGLTVKNPTEDEAKMIFDEAKRLGLSTYAEHRIALPFIWWSVTDTVSRCADSDWPVEQIFVTAKEFVQRMQNWRG